jgi:hypothetical protein
MKFITAIILSLSLTGCFYQSVDQFDIHRAITVCKDVNNISNIESWWTGNELVQCYSGERAELREIKGERK